ncbi:SulP family inorganic anion transporter [Thermodesulfobacteriota bacterium]
MLKKISFNQSKTEILSGLTVSLALIPEAVAFALVAGVNPMVGLYAAFFVGLITALFGGRPGMISGATGALAVVIVSLVTQHGVEYLFATVVLMGAIQVVIGLLRLGKFIRIVPHPVMLGFVNGLAIVIFLAQLGQFKVADAMGKLGWLQGSALYTMLGLVAMTMIIIKLLPKLTKAVPSPLVAILAVFGVTHFFGIQTRNVGDMANILGGLPTLHIPMVPISAETLKIIFPYAVIMACVGLIESLLTLTLIGEITESRGRNNKECVAQGISNVVTGFFGGMGGCAMIGQSMINISSGARHRLSGAVAAICLLVFVVFAGGIIEQIPLAALAGVMFMVVIDTFAWSSIRVMNKIPRADAFVIILVSGVTVYADLAIAVLIGIIVSALVYAWESAKHITATTDRNEDNTEKTYNLYGPVFFGSISSFRDLFHPKTDQDSVIVDFEHSRVWDHSAIEALEKLAMRYASIGKSIKYKRLSSNCANMLERSGCVVERDSEKDPRYEVVMDFSHLSEAELKLASSH